MTITFTPSTGVTIDETGGLQFNGSAGNTVPATDNDDKDVSLATLLAQQLNFHTRLFTDLALSPVFATANGVCFGSIGTATSTTPITSITPAFTTGASSGLFATNGKELFLYGTALDPNIVLLREADGSGNPNPTGAIAAAIYLKVDVDGTQTSEDVSVWMVQFEALKSPNAAQPDETITLANLSLSVGSLLEFSFDNAPSGSNYFMTFGSETAALLVSGKNPVDDSETTQITKGDTIVSSQGGEGATLGSNNQMLNPGEGLHFRFVAPAPADRDGDGQADDGFYLVPNLSSTEADHEANTLANSFVTTREASVSFSQVQPGHQYFTAKLSAFSADKSAALETGTHYGEELDNDTPVAITGVEVLRGGVNVANTDPPGSAPPVTVTIAADGTVQISGLTALDKVTYTTSIAHNHVLIESVSGANFDIGGFAISLSETTSFAINNITFDDDAPSIALTTNGQVTHDESAGLQTQTDGNQSTATEDDNDDDVAAASLPAALSARLTALGLSGQIGQATSGSAVVTANGGADGVASLSLAIKLAGVSGLSAVNGGAVTLAVDAVLNNLVIGKDTQGDTVVAIYLGSDGKVTIVQYEALVNPTAGNGSGGSHDEQIDINDGVLFAVVTDGDGDKAEVDISERVNFEDDGPSITTTGTEPTATVDETDLTTNATANFSVNFVSSFGTDGAGTLVYALGVSAPGGVDSGLVDIATNNSVFLFLEAGVVVGREGTSAADALAGDIVFTASVNSATGVVTLDQQRAIVHPNAADPDDSKTLSADTLITLRATKTDGDSDTAVTTLNIAQNLIFDDDGPTITAPFDADPVAAGIQTPERLGNAVGQTASGTFGYDIGADAHLAAFYAAGGSDFVDTNGTLAGVQINLTGTVDNAQNPNITNAVVTLGSESLTSASFNFSFHYDADPITAGVQDATAGGTLVFDKANDTYTFTLNDAIDGFSFDVLHTTELIAKQPTGNTGHPLIVAEQLTPNGDPNPFFVQFTANSTTQQIGFGFNSTGDGAPNGPPTDVSFTQGAHDMVTNINEDWVSATQTTNGVAGDTIQKGELLTLRFFEEDILSDVDPDAPGGGTERLDPTTSASGVVIKFDGIGNAEDLVVILDLKDGNGNEVTRAVNVENSDLIKGNANVPSPYNAEFTLDNNDALLILEQNDYTVAGETYQIQGIQIMQSANGLTGNAINLNGATGANGGSSATSNLTAWDPTDNDVLKIVDIGFVQQTTATIDANLDFSFALADADFDPTAMQHLLVNVSNNWIV